MNDRFSEAALSSLNERIGSLQSSARKTLPMFVIGILATLVAAGVALYYIFTLSAGLRDARAQLKNTEVALDAARSNLAIANAALRDVQAAAATSSTSSPVTRENSAKIAEAIFDVSRSQRELTVASNSIKEAASKLPAATKIEEQRAYEQRPMAESGWFAVIGSYPMDATGLAKASAQAERAKAAGLCTETWQTRISGNYALVIGSRSDRAVATRNAARARKAGLADDAFAQPDREWVKLPQSADC